MAQHQVARPIQERADRHRPLPDAPKETNRPQSQIRVRIEHSFGSLSQAMKGFDLRSLGPRRNAAALRLINLIDKLARAEPIVRLKR